MILRAHDERKVQKAMTKNVSEYELPVSCLLNVVNFSFLWLVSARSLLREFVFVHNKKRAK